MRTKVSKWQRIALMAAASTGVVSTAWGAPGLYQMHADASIWQYTGAPCAGNSCLGWVQLDNNPITATIAAGAGKLYQVHTDGTIWSYTGPACNGSSCPGWVMLDNNPLGQSIGVGGAVLYEGHSDGSGPGSIPGRPATATLVPGG